MIKLIRSFNTGLFLTETGEWTNDPLKAKRFKDYASAQMEATRLGLAEVELFLCFAEEDPTLSSGSGIRLR